MLKELREDIRVNDYRITPILILVLYRISNKIYYSNLPKVIKNLILLVLKVIQKLFVDLIFGVEIPYKAIIGKGLRIVHPKCIVIAETAIIGEYCTIFHQTTVGVNEHSTNMNAANIGNNVYIGAGGKIIGNVYIEDSCKIGANAVVTKNLKKNTTVICSQRIIEI